MDVASWLTSPPVTSDAPSADGPNITWMTARRDPEYPLARRLTELGEHRRWLAMYRRTDRADFPNLDLVAAWNAQIKCNLWLQQDDRSLAAHKGSDGYFHMVGDGKHRCALTVDSPSITWWCARDAGRDTLVLAVDGVSPVTVPSALRCPRVKGWWPIHIGIGGRRGELRRRFVREHGAACSAQHAGLDWHTESTTTTSRA